MNLYTTKELNVIFTVKRGVDTSEFIKVENKDIFKVLIEKNQAWALQALIDSHNWCLVFEQEKRHKFIDKIVSVSHIDNLSDECQDCVTVPAKGFDIDIKSAVLSVDYNNALDVLSLLENIEADLDWEVKETTYTLPNGKTITDNYVVLI